MAEWPKLRNGRMATYLIYHFDVNADRAFGTESCHEVFFSYFTKLDLLFLYRSLLGGVESLRGKYGI
jgi:hypothetical protein